MAKREHGEIQLIHHPSGSKGVHGIRRWPNVLDEAARAAIVQVPEDEGGVVRQTAGTDPGYYAADGAGGWTPLFGGGSSGDPGAFTELVAGQTVVVAVRKGIILSRAPRVDGQLIVNGNIRFLPPPRVRVEAAYSGPGTFDAPNNSLVLADPSGGTMTVRLPSAGRPGESVTVKNPGASTNVITVSANGNFIDGLASRTMSTARETSKFIRQRGQSWSQEI